MYNFTTMTKTKVDNIQRNKETVLYYWLIRLIWLIIFLVPLLFDWGLWLGTADSFTLVRSVVWRSLVLLLVVLVALENWFNSLSTRRHPLFWLAGGYVFILLILLPFSLNLTRSIEGAYQREMGVLTFLYLLLWVGVLVKYLQNHFTIIKILQAILLASWAINLYGLMQSLGWDPFVWEVPTQWRIISTLGQPTFLAQFLLLVMPVNLYFSFWAKTKVWRWLGRGALAGNLACLFFTLSRAGWLGFLVGFSWLVIMGTRIFAKKRRWSGQKARLVLAGLILVIGTGLGAIGVSKSVKPRLNIWQSHSRWLASSIKARLDVAQAAWRAIKIRPIVGYGLESQEDVLVRFFERDWLYHGDLSRHFNRAHNWILDKLLTGGIIELLVYSMLLAGFFYYNRRNFSYRPLWPLPFLLEAGVIAYLVACLFGFFILASEVYFWTFLGLTAAIFNFHSLGDSPQFNDTRFNKKPMKILLIAAIILMAAVQIKYEFTALLNDYYYRQIQREYLRGDKFFALLDNFSFIKTGYHNEYYQRRFVDLVSETIAQSRFLTVQYAGKKALWEEVGQMPEVGFFTSLYKAHGLALLTQSSTDTDYHYGRQLLERLQQESPQYYWTYYYRALLEKNAGQYDLSLQFIAKARSLLISRDEYVFEDKRRQGIMDSAFFKLDLMEGDIYLAQNKEDLALGAYQRAMANPARNRQIYHRLAAFYYERGNLAKAIEYNQLAWQRYPDQFVWPYMVAVLYDELGERQKAREFALKAQTLAPQDESVKELLDRLGISSSSN
ncbi:hypothetical protein D6821_00585 [Candidatus Parcubacteria bacterium]|nr:MAG: hypothetical protein D6821_00585 [Candidatus Parcubacteria bacterium]